MLKYFLTIVFMSPLIVLASQNAETEKDSLKIYRVPSITVSSQHAEKNTSPVPFSEIKRSEIQSTYTTQDLPQLLSELPSILTFSENGNNIGYTNLSLRGFDQRRISVMINGIPQNDPGDHNFYWINLSDFASTLENVQVQRGAGLSSYGPAAIGGSILLTTVNYAKFKGVNISSGIGFQEYSSGSKFEQISSRYGIEFSSGITENYAFYAKLARINSFGYRSQSWANLNSYFFSAMRFDGDLTTQLNIYGGSQTDGLAYNGLPYEYIKKPELRRRNYNYFSYDLNDGKTINWTTLRRNQEVEEFSQPQIELLNDWRVTEKVMLKSAAFFKLGDGYFDYDGTGWTDAASFRLTPENGYADAKDPQNPIIRSFVGNKTFGWIPRIEIENEFGKSMFGVEIRIHRSEHWGKINFAEDLPSNFDPDFKFYSYDGVRNIYSVFGSQYFNINDDLTINLEAQLVNHLYAIQNEKAGNVYSEYKTMNGAIIQNGNRIFDINYMFFNPRIGLNYKINSKNRAYFSSGYTSREPRMRNLYAASDSWTGAVPLFEKVIDTNGVVSYNFENPLVKPEQMLNFELGWSFDTDNFALNINGYWMEYFDELVKSGQLDIFGAPIDGNAPKTRHYGIEMMASAKVIESADFGNISLSVNTTISRNEIVEYNFSSKKGDLIDLSGNSIAGFPDLIGNIRVSYSYEDFYTSFLVRHVGEFRTDNFGDLILNDPRVKAHLGGEYYANNKVESYTVMNMDIGYTFRNISGINSLKLQGQINNITNLLYAASGIGKEFFPAAERNFFIGFELGL